MIYKLALTEEDLDAIDQGLQLLPYGKVAPIIARINAQIEFIKAQQAEQQAKE